MHICTPEEEGGEKKMREWKRGENQTPRSRYQLDMKMTVSPSVSVSLRPKIKDMERLKISIFKNMLPKGSDPSYASEK